MSSLLPIFLNPQAGPHAIGGGADSSPELLGQVSKEQAKPSVQAFAKSFSHVLREHGDAAALLQHLQSFLSTRNQPAAVSSGSFVEKDVRHLEGLVGPETVENSLGKLQAHGGEQFPDEFLPLTAVSGRSLDLARLLSVQALPVPVGLPTESVSKDVQSNSIHQVSLSGRVPTIPLSFLQGFQPSLSTVFQENKFQYTGGDSSLKPMSHESAIDGKISGNGHIPWERPILENETRQTPLLPRFSRPVRQSPHGQTQPIAPAAVIPVEGPAGFAGPNVTNQLFVKTIPGNLSLASEAPGSGIEHRTTVQADLLGETGLLAKGDRAQSAVDVFGKTVSLDPSGRARVGEWDESILPFSIRISTAVHVLLASIGVRGLEERGLKFPAPALQRLQLDVQLSETQRVQIDVGVQNRQVYAGLVMDHSVLRNLANQFVPQLENQLADVDLELQEFSAEVREDGEQGTHTMFDDARSHEGSTSGQGAQEELFPTRNPVGRQEEPGLHLVA